MYFYRLKAVGLDIIFEFISVVLSLNEGIKKWCSGSNIVILPVCASGGPGRLIRLLILALVRDESLKMK